ncbi:hypothetical protein LIQ05_17070 [Blautia glucerasea]|uniref:hypothetical protein n=1 Tax=Blautia glucerasea TaxID=536633 RepID=UPI001D021409|nr:hypothetical protein [Blautia glucerasea]MCB5388679.1 hypothetical protein [Blautia glucerasea]MCB5423014.1 hypothetical protein [Blautia luti]
MKRNSKRFLALFLSVAMTITPAVLTQAEGEDVNVLVTATPTPAAEEKAADMDDQKTASEDTSNTASSEESPATEEPAKEIPSETPAPEQTPAAEADQEPEQTPEATVTPAEEKKEEAKDTKTSEKSDSKEETGKTDDTTKADVKPDGSDITIDKPDDSGALGMFKIASSSARHEGDKTIVTIVTATDKYDAIYLGSVEDAKSDPENVCVGTPTGEGYTFEFAVPSTEEDQKYQVAIRKKEGGVWYQYSKGGEFTITIPGNKAPTPTVTPVPSETPAPAPTATPTPAVKPAGNVCDSGIYNVTVNSSATMFRVVNCVLTSKNGKMTAVLTLSGTGYDYLFLGTKEEAAAADSSKWVPYVVNADGKYTYEIPVESLDDGIAVAAFSHKKQIWYDRILTFQSETLNKIGDVQDDPETPDDNTDTPATVTPTPTAAPTPSSTPTPTPSPKPDKKPEKESKYESDLSGGTAAVNSSTTLADGTYTPDSFSWSGGTGKVSISCSKITVTGGQAYATIVFSSEYYGYVKANGNKYYGACGGGTSTFTIPVALNQNNTIIGMTTRMSQAHEITYTIYIALKGANDPKKTDKENPASDNSMLSTGNKKLDEEAPEITGLEYKEETKLEHAKYFKLYHYAKGITLLEVDMTTDTARKAETADETTKAQDSNETASTDQLYTGNVVKYLIVPDGAVIPAGLDKDVILIQQPVESAYVASTDALNILDKLNLTDKVTSLGMEKEDCTVDSLTAALENGSVVFAGKSDDTDYKTLVKSQCGLAILSSDILPAEESEVNDKMELLKDAAEKYSTLKIPFIVDRSSDEKDEEAKAEWEKAYEAVFVTSDEA